MYISVDVGGTSMRIVGASSLEDPTFETEPFKQNHSGNFATDIDFVIAASRFVAKNRPIQGLGIGITGELNDEKTGLASAHNLPHWVEENIDKILQDQLNCPVFVENDAITAGLGEAVYGYKFPDFNYIIWGTGVGGARFYTPADGKVEIDNYNADRHDNFSQWEQNCGGRSIEKEFRKSTFDFTDAEWNVIHERFKDNVNAYLQQKQPNALVFSGGLAALHSNLINEIDQTLDIPVAVSKFNENGGLVGGFGLLSTMLG